MFDPMGAAHHATQVFSGTVWTSRTLLARQMAYLGELERKDGRQRVFKVGWEEIAEVVPRYGEQVRARIAQFGRDHPFIRTEYFLEELDTEGTQTVVAPFRVRQEAVAGTRRTLKGATTAPCRAVRTLCTF